MVIALASGNFGFRHWKIILVDSWGFEPILSDRDFPAEPTLCRISGSLTAYPKPHTTALILEVLDRIELSTDRL
jgi:hypothetical protein